MCTLVFVRGWYYTQNLTEPPLKNRLLNTPQKEATLTVSFEPEPTTRDAEINVQDNQVEQTNNNFSPKNLHSHT